jgi:hypothetical protein
MPQIAQAIEAYTTVHPGRVLSQEIVSQEIFAGRVPEALLRRWPLEALAWPGSPSSGQLLVQGGGVLGPLRALGF